MFLFRNFNSFPTTLSGSIVMLPKVELAGRPWDKVSCTLAAATAHTDWCRRGFEALEAEA
jgi:hypothetical protein